MTEDIIPDREILESTYKNSDLVKLGIEHGLELVGNKTDMLDALDGFRAEQLARVEAEAKDETVAKNVPVVDNDKEPALPAALQEAIKHDGEGDKPRPTAVNLPIADGQLRTMTGKPIKESKFYKVTIHEDTNNQNLFVPIIVNGVMKKVYRGVPTRLSKVFVNVLKRTATGESEARVFDPTKNTERGTVTRRFSYDIEACE